jgi:hypothetical protein
MGEAVTTKTANPFGLEFCPKDGRESDAYNVASTVCILRGKSPAEDSWLAPARHAVALHVVSGKLHRIAERQCNEDLTCRACDGGGLGTLTTTACRACAGRGSTLGRREARLEAGALEIAKHYGLGVYFQGDPRGCSLYIGDAEHMNGANYNRGHAVVRLGR